MKNLLRLNKKSILSTIAAMMISVSSVWAQIVPSGSTYKIACSWDGRLLTSDSNTGAEGQLVKKYDDNNWDNTQWVLWHVGNNEYLVQNKWTSKALTAYSQNNGDQLYQHTWLGYDNQKWKIAAANGTTYSIINKWSGKALTANAQTNGSLVSQVTFVGIYQVNQVWSINAVGTTPPPATGKMQLGTNFWNPYWGTGATDYFAAGTNFSNTTNPWNPTFLNEIGIYKCFRFMDFAFTNFSTLVNWSERTPKTNNHLDVNACPKGIAYEWMIDLCNRKNADMWVSLPHQSTVEYWTALANLIKNNLNSNLKVYIEYSNETWNDGFGGEWNSATNSWNDWYGTDKWNRGQNSYCRQKGVWENLPGAPNNYYQGGAYSVYKSLQVFQAFQDVFGAAAMGNRVIRVCSWSGNFDIADKAFAGVLNSTTWNPKGQKVDIGAIAPYIQDEHLSNNTTVRLDGAASNIATKFRTEVDRLYSATNGGIAHAVNIATKYGFKLGTYEAGQHLLVNAHTFSANSKIYDEYI